VASKSDRGPSSERGLSPHQKRVRADARRGQRTTTTDSPPPRNGKRHIRPGSTTNFLKLS
jgi:hypothetical protein